MKRQTATSEPPEHMSEMADRMEDQPVGLAVGSTGKRSQDSEETNDVHSSKRLRHDSEFKAGNTAHADEASAPASSSSNGVMRVCACALCSMIHVHTRRVSHSLVHVVVCYCL